MTTQITGLLPAVAYDTPDETIKAFWLEATGFTVQRRWREAADAWARTARACPEGAARDRALFWSLAGECARRARGPVAKPTSSWKLYAAVAGLGLALMWLGAAIAIVWGRR